MRRRGGGGGLWDLYLHEVRKCVNARCVQCFHEAVFRFDSSLMNPSESRHQFYFLVLLPASLKNRRAGDVNWRSPSITKKTKQIRQNQIHANSQTYSFSFAKEQEGKRRRDMERGGILYRKRSYVIVDSDKF